MRARWWLIVMVALAGSPRDAQAAPKTIEEANAQILADAMERFDLVPGTFLKVPPYCSAIHTDDLARKKLRARWDQMLTAFPADAALYAPIVEAQDALLLDGLRSAVQACRPLEPKTDAAIRDIEVRALRMVEDPAYGEDRRATAGELLEKAAKIRADAAHAVEPLRRDWEAQNDPTMIAAYVRAYVGRASFPPAKAALVGLVRARLAFYEATLGATEMKALSEKVKGFKYSKKMFALP